MPRMITDKEKEMLLELESEKITYDTFVKLFANRTSKKDGKVERKDAQFNTNDTMRLLPSEYFVDAPTTTTVGRFIFNKFIVEPDLKEVLGYINHVVDGGGLKTIDSILGDALLEDKIVVKVMIRYLEYIQWMGMKLHDMLSGSYTLNLLIPDPKMQKHRDKLLNENREKIENGDVITAVKIERECLEMARQSVENDPGMEVYLSGARGSFGNNYKNISVMKGPVYNPGTGKFDIVESNFMEGIRKKELAVHGNAIVTGAYPKAIGTATSGYFSKQLTAALQAVVLDASGTDCKTKFTVKQLITKKNKQGFAQRYIKVGDKLVLLTNSELNKHIGKYVDLRTPMMCANPKICSKCAGEMYHLLGVKNIGLTSSRAASTTLNMKMKKFHDATAKTTELVLDDMFITP